MILYADGSYDPDGFLGNLEWTFSEGGNYYGSPAYHTFNSAGTYTATLTVYDSQGATGTTTLTIQVGVNPLEPTSVVSRKTHRAAGIFDINLPLTGTAGIECRAAERRAITKSCLLSDPGNMERHNGHASGRQVGSAMAARRILVPIAGR